jgi:hypothetical protein
MNPDSFPITVSFDALLIKQINVIQGILVMLLYNSYREFSLNRSDRNHVIIYFLPGIFIKQIGSESISALLSSCP